MRSVKTWPRSRSRGDLDFVDGHEFHRAVERHGLDGANEILGALRRDLFLACDQRRRRLPLSLDHPVIDLPRQQPERQPDHAGGVTEHPLDREVGFAGIGGTQNTLEHRFGPGALAHHPTMGPACGDFKPKTLWGQIPE